MCLISTIVRYKGCGHNATTRYPCIKVMNQQPCSFPLEVVEEFSAHKYRNCVEEATREKEEARRQQEEARCQQEEVRRLQLDQELAAAGLAQAARAAEALNRRLYAESNAFGLRGESGYGATAPGHDSDGRQQQNEYEQRANAGLAQAARATDALRRRLLRESHFDIQDERRDRQATPFSGVDSDNGNDDNGNDDNDDDEMWSPESLSESSSNLVIIIPSPPPSMTILLKNPRLKSPCLPTMDNSRRLAASA